MKSLLAAFCAGSLFAVGLAVSGMTLPSKVIGFLDVAGDWDPSLALVMAAAVLVHFAAHRIVLRRRSPLFDVKFHLPTRTSLDIRLLTRAAIFGIGWGLGGFCPGPGLVAAAAGGHAALVFVGGMTGGMVLEQALARALATAPHEEPREPRKGTGESA